MKTKTKATPKKRRRPTKVTKPSTPPRSAEQLADEFEAEAKRLQSVADILRGKG